MQAGEMMKYKIGDKILYFDNGNGIRRIDNIVDIIESKFLSGKPKYDSIQYVVSSSLILREDAIVGYAESEEKIRSEGKKTEAKLIDNNPVNNPSHYTKGAVECIDAMQSALSHEQFVGFLKGQIIKYAWRCDHKANSIQDIEKAIWYAKKLVEVLKNEAL